jgi:hypothetical protein
MLHRSMILCAKWGIVASSCFLAYLADRFRIAGRPPAKPPMAT